MKIGWWNTAHHGTVHILLTSSPFSEHSTRLYFHTGYFPFTHFSLPYPFWKPAEMFSSSVTLPSSLIFASCEQQIAESLFHTVHEYWLVTTLIRKCFRVCFFVLHRDPSYFLRERKQSFQFRVCDVVITQSQNGGLKRSPVRSLGSLISVPVQIFSIGVVKFSSWSGQWRESKSRR